MCGIAGLISPTADIAAALEKAEKTQFHRGPDMQGQFQCQINLWNVGFAHQRLSILDLSDAGKQPLHSSNSVLVYNGEIYNYVELKYELEQEGRIFNTNCDTEVILAALECWGVEEACNKFNGMWAFAWLDKRRNKLVLARDRAGVKPLYYLMNQKELYFSSELKTILAMTQRKFDLNTQKVGEYLLQYLTETSEDTFFEGINKANPATFLEVDLNTERFLVEKRTYWQPPFCNSTDNSLNDDIEKTRELFFDAVRLRLRSDVPVGVLLSGGIDSSAIASAMNQILGANADLHLLSVVSLDKRYDETPFIDAMGRYLKRDIHKVVLDFSPEQAFHYLEQVCWYNDEPVSSFSNVAQYLLMKQAKDLGITVVLSGQGADELLCGYKKYLGFYIQQLIRRKQYGKASTLLYQYWKQGTIIKQFSLREAKRYLPKRLTQKDINIQGENLKNFTPLFLGLEEKHTVLDRQILDLQRFSIPVLTHYEDRMSMAWAREVRVPFLDYRLIEHFLSLPTEAKLMNGWTKFVFRKAMEPFMPEEVVWRKDKQGFVNPQSEWFKGYLREGVLQYFGEDSLIFKYGFVNRNNLLRKYNKYCKQAEGRGIISFQDIFTALSLEIWMRKFEEYIA